MTSMDFWLLSLLLIVFCLMVLVMVVVIPAEPA